MGTAPQYLPPTPEQAEKLAKWIMAGYTVVRVVDKGVETLRITKPRNSRSIQKLSRNR